MLNWIKKNKEWLFSGVLVAVIGAGISYFWPGGNDPPSAQPDSSIHQTHSGSGNNVTGDNNTITDKSIHQSNSGGGDNVGRDKIINPYLSGSEDYKLLEQELKVEEEMLTALPQDKIELRLKQAAKVKKLRKELEDFKETVFRLHEQFTRIPIDNERLRKAKAHFDRGEFREADAVLKAEEIERDVERLKLKDNSVSNKELIAVNKAIRSTGIEAIGAKLRGYMSAMKPII